MLFVKFVESGILPTLFSGRFARRHMGVTAAVFDVLAEGFAHAVRAPWVSDTKGVGPAVDILGDLGAEVGRPRYPRETWQSHKSRINTIWDTAPLDGTESVLLLELAAAGFPGAQVQYTSDSVNWSEFWIFFPAGTHTITAEGPPVGSFSIGDGTHIGPVGLLAEDLATMRAIIRAHKPAHWVCSKIVFQLTGWSVGDGHHVGDPGLVIGGTNVSVAAY